MISRTPALHCAFCLAAVETFAAKGGTLVAAHANAAGDVCFGSHRSDVVSAARAELLIARRAARKAEQAEAKAAARTFASGFSSRKVAK